MNLGDACAIPIWPTGGSADASTKSAQTPTPTATPTPTLSSSSSSPTGLPAMQTVWATDFSNGWDTGGQEGRAVLPGRWAAAQRVRAKRHDHDRRGRHRAWHYNVGPAVGGKVIDVAVEVHFSADQTKSWMSAWYGGNQVLSNVNPVGAGTLYKGQISYLKTGIYRDTAIQQAGIRYLESLVIGKPV